MKTSVIGTRSQASVTSPGSRWYHEDPRTNQTEREAPETRFGGGGELGAVAVSEPCDSVQTYQHEGGIRQHVHRVRDAQPLTLVGEEVVARVLRDRRQHGPYDERQQESADADLLGSS